MKNSNGMQAVYDMDNLYAAFLKCSRQSIWKESVQRYEMNLLRNLTRTQRELEDGTYRQRPFYEFTLMERGKTRDIKAVNIYDRVVMSSLCENVLNPRCLKYLIHDNGASVRGKGIQFARNRLDAHLHRFYRHCGNDGYILLIDFTKYFDNIRHEKLLDEFAGRMDDAEVVKFVEKIIDTFKVDVSYMSDQEYAGCMDAPFDALAYVQVDRARLAGEKYMRKSVGIGSQISQIAGLLYPVRIDNYVKIVRGVKYYGRYMDDIYIIDHDKRFLRELLNEIDGICKEYGIFINRRKTQICRLSKTFTFLKTRYSLTDTGRIVKRISRDCIARERRKLKTFKRKLDAGEMTYEDIAEAYSSWRGSLGHYDSYHITADMDRLYNSLFITPFVKGGTDHDRSDKAGKGTENPGFAGTA